MEKISKEDMQYLIEKGILKPTYKYNYGDDLIVTGRFSSCRSKQRYVPTNIYNKLMELKKQEVSDLSKVKFNQRYMFSDNNQCVS